MTQVAYTRINEGAYPGEFAISEGNGKISREQGIVNGAIAFEPGTVIAKKADGSIAPYDYRGTLTDVDEVAGIAWEGVDLKAGQKRKISYVARLAEVNEKLVVVHAYGAAANPTQKAAVIAALKALTIIAR